jgi:hypothetical protein
MDGRFLKQCCRYIIFALLLLSVGALTESPAAEVGEFNGSCVANGTRKLFPFSADRQVYTYRISGHVSLQTSLGKQKNFWSECVGLSDSVTGSVARCVWTDLSGPKIYITLQSDRLQTDSQVTGTIVGGTDRFKGISGDLSFDWTSVTFQEEANGESSVTGQTLNLSGRYQIP